MYYADYTEEEENAICKELKDHTLEKSIADYTKLRERAHIDLDGIKPLSPIGLKFIENFVHRELLNTKSKHRISFYDFWFHRDFYMHRDNATTNLVASIRKNKPYLTDIKIGKQVFNLYYGSISIFRPTNAAKLYAYLKPSCVLDFTMGWGGRMVGAAIMNVPKYIGIDMNTRLEEPYKQMTKHLQGTTETELCIWFKDALTIDYGTLKYDMVFTSPPFYNKETYGDIVPFTTNDDWDEQFYRPIFTKTWNGMKMGGNYCLNIPVLLYDRVCVPLFGEADELIELKKYSRILPKTVKKQTNVGQKYKEYIYIWKKSTDVK